MGSDEDKEVTALLAGLLPSRWAKAKHRAGVLKEYQRLQSPTMEETARFAAQIGLNRTRFRLIARTFQEARTPSVETSVMHYPRVDPKTDKEITAALDRLGLDALQDDLHAVVAAACRRKGLPEPSYATVRRRLLDAKAGVAPLERPSGITVLDEVELGVLIEARGDRIRPRLVAAVDERSGDIKGWDVDVGSSKEEQGARALLHAGMTSEADLASVLAHEPDRWAGAHRHPLLSRLGRQIGRIPTFASGGPVHAKTPTDVVVDLDDLRSVVNAVLSKSRRSG